VAGFIEGCDREQLVLFPDRLGDWISEDHPVRVIDAFVDALDLAASGFQRTAAAGTGRPGYHPSVLLKLFVYGYLNRVPSSRRLELEAARNVEVMWLTGRLVPDHKTIADFRKDNGAAIRKVCARFVEIARRVGVLSGGVVAIDGSKFKAVNHRDRNFTAGKVKLRISHLEESAAGYLEEMARIDRQEAHQIHATKVTRIEEKLARIRQEVRRLEGIARQLDATPDGQISLTDPDARSMATYGKGTGVVGYNVQTAVDTHTHLIVAHEVTNVGNDRAQLAPMARAAKAALEAETIEAIADRGYFNGAELLACHEDRITATVPRPETSGNRKKGMFVKADFAYDAESDVYRCPSGQLLTYRYTTEEDSLTLLAERVPALSAEEPMHHRQGTADHPLGARASRRGDVRPDGPGPRTDAPKAQHGRAPLRHDQGVDGRYAFPDATAAKRPHRDGAACARLQHQADDRTPWGRPAPPRDPHLSIRTLVQRSD
jgi:transposase